MAAAVILVWRVLLVLRFKGALSQIGFCGGKKVTEKVDRSNLKHFVLTLPWALARFCGRIVRRFFVALGVLAALIVIGYVEFESIVEAIDARYSAQIDAYLAIDKNAIARLHDPAYF